MNQAKFMQNVCRLTALLLSSSSTALALGGTKLQNCLIVVEPQQSATINIAATVLAEEVERRTSVHWQTVSLIPDRGCTIQLSIGGVKPVGDDRSTSSSDEQQKPESFVIRATSKGDTHIELQGADARGVLFGVGYLLRQFSMQNRAVLVPEGVGALVTTQSPAFTIRGHQLGYRPKNNTFDGWSLAQFDQYIRDLTVFGTNTIEIIPPRSDDAPTSPLYTLAPLQMMKGLSGVIDRYGLDCSIWYPALDKDYSDPGTVQAAVKEWGAVFRELPRVDAVFVPGGDPGHTEPKFLFSLLEQEAAELRKTHPRAQMWVSPQSFSATWLNEFYALLAAHPVWLTGVVYGPEMRDTPEQFRKRVPAEYPIRFYPDITHTASAQYSLQHWDPAFAFTEGREPVDPRPVDEGILFHRYAPSTTGFVAYSEGSNDDINKVLWSAWGWDPSQSSAKILEQYARYFVSPSVSATFVDGVTGLEENWRGPLNGNSSIPKDLKIFEEIAQKPEAHPETNWRLQQVLYRANYDAYVQQRSRSAHVQEQKALSALEQFGDADPKRALRLATTSVAAVTDCLSSALCRRTSSLANDLFRTIRMQLSVERYNASAVDRGANLDAIDAPIASLEWLRSRLSAANAAATFREQSKVMRSVVTAFRPEKSILRDNLGLAGERPHLVNDISFMQDPSGLSVVYDGVTQDHAAESEPLAFRTYAGTLYDVPIQMRYSDLRPHVNYQLRVHFAMDGAKTIFRANGVLLAPRCVSVDLCTDTEVNIPARTNLKGKLLFEWSAPPGQGGNGRRLKISQVELAETQ